MKAPTLPLAEVQFCNLCIRALGSLGAKREVSTTVYDVWDMYTKGPGRIYHAKPHPMFMVDWILKKVQKTDLGRKISIPRLIVDTLYHDVKCVPGSLTNEEESADKMTCDLTLMGVPRSEITPIVEDILDTKHQKVPETEESKCLVDADLASLAISFEPCWENTLDLWRESGKDAKTFASCCAGFLNGFLSRSSIYYSSFMGVEDEDLARSNLTEIIRRLTDGELGKLSMAA